MCAKIALVKDLHTPLDWIDPTCGPATWTSHGPWTIGHWPQVDSTNSTAHRALHSGITPAALHRTVYTAAHQFQGRGQNTRVWSGEAGKDLAMSILLTQSLPSASPFALNLAVSLSVLEGIESRLPQFQSAALEIKWPNDIMLKGKKAGGILIENNWRGNSWSSAVIGIGLNVGGNAPYPNAIRLMAPSETNAASISLLEEHILNRLDARLSEMASSDALLRQYHERLLGWGCQQRWQLDGKEIRGVLERIDLDGRLCVLNASGMSCHAPGEVGWLGMEPRRPFPSD